MKDEIILIVKEAIANHTWSDKDDYAPNTDIYRIDSEDIDHIAEQVADELLKIKITLPLGRCNGKISEVLNFLSDLAELQEYRQKIEDGELVSKDWHDEQVMIYEDVKQKIEQGRLIELPCKVGDKIFFVYDFGSVEGECIDCDVGVVASISYQQYGVWIYAKYKSFMTFWHRETDIGKTIFFTKEEAEAKLATLSKTETVDCKPKNQEV